MGLWHPEAYQGSRKRRNYFEGWYYKLVNRDRSRSLALIPGLALGEKKTRHTLFCRPSTRSGGSWHICGILCRCFTRTIAGSMFGSGTTAFKQQDFR